MGQRMTDGCETINKISRHGFSGRTIGLVAALGSVVPGQAKRVRKFGSTWVDRSDRKASVGMRATGLGDINYSV